MFINRITTYFKLRLFYTSIIFHKAMEINYNLNLLMHFKVEARSEQMSVGKWFPRNKKGVLIVSSIHDVRIFLSNCQSRGHAILRLPWKIV